MKKKILVLFALIAILILAFIPLTSIKATNYEARQPANTFDLSNCVINGTIRIDKNLTYSYAEQNGTAYLVLPYDGDVNYTSNNTSVVSMGRIIQNSANSEYLKTIIYNINGVGSTKANIMTTDEKVNIAMNVTVNPTTLHVKTANVDEKVYDGNTKATVTKFELEGFARQEEYTSGTDYIYNGTFEDANVGTNKIVNIAITLKNDVLSKNYVVSTYQAKSNITRKALKDTNVTLGTTEYTYNGTAKEPNVVVKVGDTTLVKDTDYTLSYLNNVNAGTNTSTPTAVVIGKGNYSDTVNKTFTINAKDLNSNEVTLSTTSYTYNGSEKTPVVTVKDGEKTLVKDTDYTVSYSNNTNPGTATVTVTGIGNFVETQSRLFTIAANPKKVTLSSVKNVKTNSAKVTWKKGKNIDGYEVWMAEAKTTSKKLKTTEALVLRKSTSQKSAQLLIIPAGKKVTVIKRYVKEYGGYTWYKVKYNGKTGYVASQYLDEKYEEGTYSKIKTIKNISTLNYKKTKLTIDKKYSFKVRTYKVVDGIKYYSKFSNVKWVSIRK